MAYTTSALIIASTSQLLKRKNKQKPKEEKVLILFPNKSNEALLTKLPKKLFDRRLACAIDLTLISYYGQEDEAVRRSKPQDGTSRFHCYASLYVLKKHKRYTLALTLMSKGESLLEVLKRLLARGKEIGLSIKRQEVGQRLR